MPVYSTGNVTYDYVLDRAGNALITHCTVGVGVSVVDIPGNLEGHLVTGIGDRAFAMMHNVSKVVCPESIASIGHAAFEQCRCLKSISFPRSLAVFRTGWLNGCNNLSDITLPGMVPEVSQGLFGTFPIRSMRIGTGTREVRVPRAQPLELDEIVVAEDSLWLSTDGVGLYSYDHDVLFTLVKSVNSYRVSDACARIAPYAFAYRTALHEVSLPDALELIGDLAFVECGIKRFSAPRSLKSIGNRAFMGCRALDDIGLNEGLLSLGEGSFGHTGRGRSIHVPASVTQLGPSAAGFPEEMVSGDCALSIASGNETLTMDEAGLIYRREERGFVLQDASSFVGVEARPRAGTVAIGENAFKRHQFVERVVLPEGVVSIGESAFAECFQLTEVVLPETLERIDDTAFFASSLASVRIPARCTHIGARALDTTARRDSLFRGAPRKLTRSSMRGATVDRDNPVFFVANGLLCRRLEDYPGEAEAVLYVGPDTRVTIPSEVTFIGAYAFSGATGIEILRLHKGIRELRAAALFPTTAFSRIVVETDEAEDGRGYVGVDLPPDEMGMRVIQRALYHFVDARLLMECYDAMVPNLPDHFERFSKMLDRLSDPVLLADWARDVYERDLALDPLHVCLVMAGHDYARGIDQLVELGIVDAETIREAIDRLSGNVRSISSIARLLELNHQRFGGSRIDYAL